MFTHGRNMNYHYICGGANEKLYSLQYVFCSFIDLNLLWHLNQSHSDHTCFVLKGYSLFEIIFK